MKEDVCTIQKFEWYKHLYVTLKYKLISKQLVFLKFSNEYLKVTYRHSNSTSVSQTCTQMFPNLFNRKHLHIFLARHMTDRKSLYFYF